MTFTIFSLVLIVAITFSVGKGAYNGYRRGSFKTFVCLLSVVFSLMMGCLISRAISSSIGNAVLSVLEENESFVALFNSVDRFKTIMGAVMTMAVSPIIMALIFLILQLICHIVMSIVYKKVLNDDGKTKERSAENDTWYKRNNKQIGAVVGGINGFLITVILFSPLIGTLKTTDSIINIAYSDVSEQQVEQVDADDEAEKNELSNGLDIVSDYANDFAGTVIYYCGGKAVYDMSARTEIDGHTVMLSREIKVVSNIAKDIVEVAPAVSDLNNFSGEDVEKLEHICETIDDSYFLSLVSSSLVSSASRNWAVGSDFMGIACPDFNASISAFTNSIFSVLAATTPDTVGEDLTTIVRVCGIIMDSGILETYGDYEAMMAVMEDGSFLDALISELEKNPRTVPLIDSLHLLAMNSLMSTIKFDGYDVEDYQDLMEDITEQFNRMNGQSHEKKVETLANYTVEYLQDYGVDIPVEVAKVIADAMITEIPNSDGYITTEQMQEFFEKYGQVN